MGFLKCWWRVFAMVVSVLLLAACFEPFSLGTLVWVWMLPFLCALWTLRAPEKKRRFRGVGWRGFGLGYLGGLVFWSVNLKWLWTVGGAVAVGAIAGYLALYFAVFGWFAAKWANPWQAWKGKVDEGVEVKASFRTLGYAAVLAFAWVGLEWARGWVMTGFGWNGLGVAFSETLVMAQGADVVGISGLSFVPVFMSAMIVQVMRRAWVVARMGQMIRHWDFGVAVLLLAACFVYGVYCLTFVPRRAGEEMRVLLVQENIPQELNKVVASEDEIYGGFKETMEGAMAALEEEARVDLKEKGEAQVPWPDLVVWPESGLPQPLWLDEKGTLLPGQTNEHFLKGDILSLGEFDLLAGTNIYTAHLETGMTSEEVPAYNGAMLVQAEKAYEEMSLYRKVHLVIFGETMPLVDTVPVFRWLFETVSGVKYGSNFGAGDSVDPLPYQLRGKKVSLIPSICFEDTVGRLTRRFVRDESQVIVNMTNDGWFDESEAAAQHLANAKFRAIELRLPMVRASNTGVSVVLQPTGSEYGPAGTKRAGERQMILDEEGSHFTRGWYEGRLIVPDEAAFSLYALWGDWFCYLGLAVMGGWWLFRRLPLGSK